MKKIGSLLLVWLVIALGLSSCKDGEFDKGKIIETPKVLLNQQGFTAKPSIATLDNQLYLLNSEKRGLVFYEVGKETILTPDLAGQHWLHVDGKNLYAFWWTTNNKEKFLKVRVSNDGGKTFADPITLNTSTGVLPEISIASSNGKVAVAYTDERKPGYGVYFNSSTDDGKTWLKEDLRLDTPVVTAAMQQAANTDPATFANSPKLAIMQGRLFAIWQQVDMTEMGGQILRIVTKSSSDFGKTWGVESNVFAAPNMQPVEMNMFANDKNIFIFAMLTDGGKGFTGFYNNSPESNTWTEISNAPLGVDFNKRQISWIRGVFSGENLVLAFTSEPTEGQGKVQADLIALSTNTHQWLGPVKQLDADKGHNLTKSTYPEIVNIDGFGVLVAWEDYRTLVPSIYYDLSKDNGKTWLAKPKALTTPGLVLAKDPKLTFGQDKLWVNYFMVELNGQHPQGARVYQEFTKAKDGTFEFPVIEITQPSPEKLKERLIERANKFWALREERKWEETWPYMEPVYRERFDKSQWLAQQGKLSFSKTVVDEGSVVITGNIGILDANVDVSVNQQIAKEGLLEAAPPKSQKVEMRWGWFYDDWYFMPDIIFGNHLEY